jgi:hypothetical protein
MIFGWAVTRELIPPEKYVAMKSMKLLKAYRTNARELKKVQHVPDSVIETDTASSSLKSSATWFAFSVSREYGRVNSVHCVQKTLIALR